jgi:lipoate-protein ligase A
MNAVNRSVINALRSLGVNGLSIRGISDIAIGNRKILGSSLYRRKDIVLYQGSLLLNPDFSKIETYLKHPDRGPDYRMGRGHREFLTSLWKEGYRFSSNDVLATLKCTLGQKSPWSALDETAT